MLTSSPTGVMPLFCGAFAMLFAFDRHPGGAWLVDAMGAEVALEMGIEDFENERLRAQTGPSSVFRESGPLRDKPIGVIGMLPMRQQ